MSKSWICCQIGAREHFAIPRAIHHAQRLSLLITDLWTPPDHWLHRLPSPALSKLRQRFHADLASAAVCAFPASALHFEIVQRIRRRGGWERIIAYNNWFQKHALSKLRSIKHSSANAPTLFAYSYAARDILRYAQSQGWRTVLGQIDPGPVEEKLVAHEHRLHSDFRTTWAPAPSQYWQSWVEECELADCIMVNSHWSRQALQQAGIDDKKIVIYPLACDAPAAADDHVRSYPIAFTNGRPLRVLFLGQIVLRKGIAAVLAAAKLLSNQPVEFWLVGATELREVPGLANVRWLGPVSRNETTRYYKKADLFLFPTISDGFGLTQLEAQAWKLPAIASRCCGEVVKEGVNGFVLQQVNGDAIASIITKCLHYPQMLAVLAQGAGRVAKGFTLAALRENLLNLDKHWPFENGSKLLRHPNQYRANSTRTAS